MNFRQFIERHDLTQIEQIHRDTFITLNNLINYYQKFYYMHFPKRKINQDHHDYIMNLYSIPEQWQSIIPQIYNYKVEIRHIPGKHWTTNLGQAYGEIIGQYVVLYSNIGNIINELKDKANLFVWFVKENKKNKATKIKQEAKKIHDQLMSELQKNKENLFNSLYHEIIHAARHKHIKNIEIPLRQATRQHLLQAYVNSPVELDAHFLEKAYSILRTPVSSFHEFLNKFKEAIGAYHFKLLMEKNKRKMISRLYQLYTANK